jgi:glycosyltransferase involved in cell wall biosynthesis
MSGVSVIVATYNQPRHLARCLLALDLQSYEQFDIVIADDGSAGETRQAVEDFAHRSRRPVRHVWQEDRGFRKTEILNKAVLASGSDYLVFMDGDCVAHRDFVREHVRSAAPGHYLNGSLIRLGPKLSECLTEQTITGGEAFRAGWLMRQGGRLDRRYLRLSLSHGLRSRLNRASRTRLYWLGSNASCYREDLMAVNGFDNRFSYGFEDGDFGNRLEMCNITPRTVRWTANLLHLWHPRPWSDPAVKAANLELMNENLALRRCRAVSGLQQISREEALSQTPLD